MRNVFFLIVFLFASLFFPYIGLSEEIIIMYPKYQERDDSTAEKVRYEKNIGEYVGVSLQTFVAELRRKAYKVDSIELWIDGIVKTDQTTKIFVPWEGEGTCKIILKP
jgi:hypothetical protein